MPSVLDLVSHPTRQKILQIVWDGEVGAGDIASRFPVTMSAVSQHLHSLLKGGLVTRRRDGRRLYYQANRAALGPLAAYLQQLWANHLDDLKNLAEADQKALRKRPKRRSSHARARARSHRDDRR